MGTISLNIDPCFYYKLLKCDGTYCYMEQAVKEYYEGLLGTFQSGDMFYGAIEGDSNYLYTWVGLTEVLETVPTCLISGVSRTTDECPV